MADEREMNAKVKFDTSEYDAGAEEAKRKTKELKDEMKETGRALDQIGTNLGSIGSGARVAFTAAAGNAKTFGVTVRASMLDSIKNGDRLTKTIRTGIGSGFNWIKGQAKGFGAAAVSVAKSTANAFQHPVQTIKSTLGHALNDARKDTEDLGTASKKVGDDLDDMGKRGVKASDGLTGALKRVAIAAVAITALATGIKLIRDFSFAAVDAAAAAEETQSKFETVFKDQATRSEEWITNFSDAAKRSKVEIMTFMADAQSVMTGVGMGIEPASEMSAAITSLTYDLASFHNLSDQDAFDKLQSGLLGQTQGLKTMGIVLNETALKQSMLNMGIRGNFQDLEEATKVQVRFNAILAQTADAQTDVTRTADSYTNGLKGVQGMWQDFLADAGALFIPTLVGMFNIILDSWPTIEPLLMGLVTILADGFADAMPTLSALGQTLIPVLTQTLGVLFSALTPLIPVFTQLAATALPPLVGLLSTLVSSILPPLVEIFMTLAVSVLQPLLPVILQLVSVLLPPFVSLLGLIAPVLQLVSPLLSMLMQLLTPIAVMLGGFISSILPPIISILQVLFENILQPLLPILQLYVSTYLPILASILGIVAPLLGVIAPILQAISPIIGYIGEALGFIAGIIAEIVGGITGFISKGVDFFAGLFGGAKDAKEEIGGVADSLQGAASAAYAPAPMPTPDTSAYTGAVTAAVNTTSAVNASAMDNMTLSTNQNMAAIGTAATDTYGGIADEAVTAWDIMTTAAQRGVDAIVEQFKRIATAAASVGNIQITATGAPTDVPPHYAGGTKHHPGGPAIINDGNGGSGELVVLPGGSEVIPADKTDRLISKASSRTVVSSPTYQIVVNGNPTDDQLQTLDERIREIARREREDAQRAADTEESIQEAYA